MEQILSWDFSVLNFIQEHFRCDALDWLTQLFSTIGHACVDRHIRHFYLFQKDTRRRRYRTVVHGTGLVAGRICHQKHRGAAASVFDGRSAQPLSQRGADRQKAERLQLPVGSQLRRSGVRNGSSRQKQGARTGLSGAGALHDVLALLRLCPLSDRRAGRHAPRHSLRRRRADYLQSDKAGQKAFGKKVICEVKFLMRNA